MREGPRAPAILGWVATRPDCGACPVFGTGLARACPVFGTGSNAPPGDRSPPRGAATSSPCRRPD
eukprot:3658254-Prymnesium_polylepis.1